MDEDYIWAFTMTSYNQLVIKNQYTRNLWGAMQTRHQPFWGTKLIAPAFYKDEKYQKLLRQWSLRLELEFVKMRQSTYANNANVEDKKHMKEEMEGMIAQIYEREIMDKWKDVYVTDHEARPKKYFTLNKKEDQDYFKYKKSLQEYN